MTSKTFDKEYSALFAVSDIKTLIKYYDIFEEKKRAQGFAVLNAQISLQ